MRISFYTLVSLSGSEFTSMASYSRNSQNLDLDKKGTGHGRQRRRRMPDRNNHGSHQRHVVPEKTNHGSQQRHRVTSEEVAEAIRIRDQQGKNTLMMIPALSDCRLCDVTLDVEISEPITSL